MLRQIRYEYNKTGKTLNHTKLTPDIVLSQHVTVVMDAIQVKVGFHLDYGSRLFPVLYTLAVLHY